MRSSLRWVVAVLAWVVLLIIYVIWKDVDALMGSVGILSGALRGALISGGAYSIYQWARGEKTKVWILVIMASIVVVAVAVMAYAMFQKPNENEFVPPPQVQEAAPNLIKDPVEPRAFSSVEKQHLDEAVVEVMNQYPILRWGSETANDEAINKTASLRDFYIGNNGIPPAEALRRAAKEIAAQYVRVEAQNSGSQTMKAKPGQTWSEQQEKRRKCNIQPVMTDAEMAACR